LRSGQTVLACGLALAAGAARVSATEPRSPVLEIEQMTFVAAQGGENQVHVVARHASFDTEREVATLTDVETTVSDEQDGVYFQMTCRSGELDLATSDFLAQGEVLGRTRNGIEFAVDWVRYDHEQGRLFTDAPVLITESFGSYRGGGFEYDVRERRLRLTGGARMVQQP
jgi:LPS export ABC transporter protein LptC